MKPINETLFAIPVPMDAEEIDKQELIDGWFELFYTTPSHSNFHYNRMNFNFTILGTITSKECSFECSKITNEWNGCNCGECFDFVKERIESTTGYLFNDDTKLLIIEKK